MTGSPRPAHLDLYGRSANIVETGMVSEPAVADPALQLTMPPYRPAPSDDEIERAAAKLRAAKRIVIVAGTGAAASGAGPELLALGEALAAPIGTSLGGRGVIPTRHRLSIGCPGNYAAPPTNQIVHEADLVLFVGCHTGDQVTHTWRIPPLDTAGGADRHRSAGTRPQLSEHARPDGRSEGDAGEAQRGDRQARRAIPRSPIVPPASSPPGARRARRCWPATPRRSFPIGCAPRSPARCPRTASWSPTPAIPASGPRR